MKKAILIILFLSSSIFSMSKSSTDLHYGDPSETNWPQEISLDFVLEKNAKGKIVTWIKIKNGSKFELEMQNPDQRLAVSFIVLDELGNLVAPTGIAKINSKEELLRFGSKEEKN